MGDPLRMMLARELINEIERNHLIENTRITGDYLKKGLQSISETNPEKIKNVRGLATFLAFDCESPAHQGKLISEMKKRGVEITGCGEVTIRLRPMLTFAPQHALQLLDVLNESIKHI